MPDVKDCLATAAADGQISRDAEREFAERYDELLNEATENQRLSFSDAQAASAKRLQREIERKLRRKKRMRVKQALKLDEVMNRINSAPAGQKEKAALAILDFDPKLRHVGENVAMRHETIRDTAFAGIADLIDRSRAKFAGLAKPAELDDVVRGLFGEKTTPEARAMADALITQRNRLVGRFNLGGGDIQQRKDWGWVQRHDPDRIGAVSEDEYVDFLRQHVDPARMFDASGQRMTDRQLTATFKAAYSNITTGGLEELAGLFEESFTSPVNARVAQRELVFRDSKSWLAYQRRFGDPDIFGSIIGEIDKLSRDVALIEIMGPYPEATLRTMEQAIQRDRGTTRSRKRGFTFLRAVFDQVTGQANLAENPGFARFMQGNRNLITGARLGGAIWVSLSDVGTAGLTARMNGLPASRVVRRWASQLNPASGADRQLAARATFIADTWVGRSVGAQRLMGEVTGPGWTNRVTDTALRLTGLNAWTDGGKSAFGLEFLGFLTDNAARPFDEINPTLRRSLQKHGFTPEQWDLYRSTEITVDAETGAQFIYPEDVWLSFQNLDLPLGEKEARFRASQRLGEIIRTEARFAIVEPTARSRALISQAGNPGSTFGEIVRNAALFKSFPITYAYLHGSRLLTQSGVGAAAYAGTLFVSATIAGAIAEQASSITRGKEARDMDDARFWLSAVIRGGSFGPLGDFLFAGFDGANRHGNSLPAALLGPVASQIEQGFAVAANIPELILEGEARNPGQDIVRFAEGLVPGQSIWYGRLAVERYVKDQIQAAIDGGEAQRSFRRQERRAKREFDQRYWWRRGRLSPEFAR